MPTATYTPLANVTLGSSASSVTFSSLSQAYRDVILVVNWRSSAANDAIVLFNSDSNSGNYPSVVLFGNSSSAQSYTQNYPYLTLGNLTNDNQISVTQIMDYSATDKHKVVLSRNNTASVGVGVVATRWTNTSNITTIQVTGAGGGTLPSGCSFAIYGVAA